jgi:nuclear pore complex protein Nup210
VDVSCAGAFFYRCDAFNSLIKWKAGSESFLVVNASQESSYLETVPNSQVHPSDGGFPCPWTHIYASNTGQAIIRATLSLEYHQFSHGPVVLKASLRIAAYLPFIVRQAGDGNHFGGYWLDLAQAENNKQLHSLEELDLVPGTNLDLLLVGGPEPWNKHVDFVETVDVLGGENDLTDGVLVHRISDNSRTLYRVLCQRMGTFVSFSIPFLLESISVFFYPKSIIVSVVLVCNISHLLCLVR